jgi:hypothetical protein
LLLFERFPLELMVFGLKSIASFVFNKISVSRPCPILNLTTTPCSHRKPKVKPIKKTPLSLTLAMLLRQQHPQTLKSHWTPWQQRKQK